MDQEALALGAALGQAVLQAMATDGWNQVRDRIARILGRGNREREQQELRSLDETRIALQEARVKPDAVIGRWQGKLETLLEIRPDLANDLRALIDDLATSENRPIVHSQAAIGNLNSTVQQAGRDIRIAWPAGNA